MRVKRWENVLEGGGLFGVYERGDEKDTQVRDVLSWRVLRDRVEGKRERNSRKGEKFEGS